MTHPELLFYKPFFGSWNGCQCHEEREVYAGGIEDYPFDSHPDAKVTIRARYYTSDKW